MASNEEIAWLAGVLEADGSFTFAYEKCPRIQFACCDKDVAERVASLIDGQISTSQTPKKNKEVYYTSKATKDKLLELLPKLLPYMGKRRTKRILELLKHLNPKEGVPSQT